MPICLPSCGHGRGNRARPLRRAPCPSFDPLAVYIYASTRSPYTYTASGSSPVQSASPKRVPLGKTPTVTAQRILGNWANGTRVRLSLRGKARLLPHAASTVRCAILRRRDTAFSSRARPLAHHANCRRAVPLRSLLAHAPLARPSAMARFYS